MTAWVIRQEREGEPIDAFQIEEIEVPEPGAFEVIVRVMAAGVNFNNVWAALGKPVSVFRYHPEDDHHIGGSDASGIVWKVGEGVTRWKVGDEVVIHCNQASYEDVEVHGLDPLAAPSQKIWGYETSWGSFAQFTKVQAQQLLPKPKNLTWEEAASYGLTYFTAYRMLIDQREAAGRPPRADLGRRRRPGRVRDAALQGRRRRVRRRRLLGREGRARQAARREGLHQPQRVRRHDAPRRRDPRARRRSASGSSRAFAKRVKEILGDAPDIVFEHVGQATFPTSVFIVKPFGKVVICGATSGFNLDFDVRYLWMRQKEIIGSHFANAWECTKANELIDAGQDPAGAVAGDALRGRRRGAPADAREQAPGQDRDPRRRRRGGSGQDGRGSGRDPRRGRRLSGGELHTREVRERRRRGRPARLPHHAVRAERFVDIYRPAVPLRSSTAPGLQLLPRRAKTRPLLHDLDYWDDRAEFDRWWHVHEMRDIRAMTSAGTGPGALRLARPLRVRRDRRRTTGTGLPNRSRSRAGRRRLIGRSRPRRAQPCSSGAIVRPAQLSCSQYSSAGSRSPVQTIAWPVLWIWSRCR